MFKEDLRMSAKWDKKLTDLSVRKKDEAHREVT